MQAQASLQAQPAHVRGFRASRGGLLMLLGGAMVVAGSLWPWYDRQNADLAAIPIESDKTLILLAGLLLALCAVLFMHDRSRFGPLAILGGGAAVASLVLLLKVALDLQTYFPKPIDLTAYLDWWFWGAMLGSFVGVYGAWNAAREKPLTREQAEVAALPAKQRARRWAGRNWLVAPAVIYAIIITQGPFIVTIWYSLQKWNLLRPENSRFNGLQNYADLLVGSYASDFRNAFINTVVLTTAAVVLSVLLGLFFAELVNSKFRGRGIVRTMLITPFLVMPVVGALGWKNMMLNPVFGVVDWVLVSIGGEAWRIDWFTNYPMLSIVIIVVWRWAPFMMIIMLAGMQALSDEVREAGRVDGASGRQEFRFIVLPHLKPFMQLCVLFGVIYILAEFDSIAMTTQGGPGDKTLNLPYLIYRTVFYANDVGHAAAMGVMLVALTFVFATYLIRLLGRLMEGSGA